MNKAENKLILDKIIPLKLKYVKETGEERPDIRDYVFAVWNEAEAYGRQQAIDVYDPYIKLLVEELGELAGIAAVHGWVTHRFEQGKKCQKAIESLKQEVR